MPTWICLLRAVNLGSRNKVSMPVLREALSEAGYDEVRTYVQSGNVVLRTPHRSAAGVGAAVREVVRAGFGVDTPVVVRTRRQLMAVDSWNPFPGRVDADPRRVYVTHLPSEPDPDDVRELVGRDWGPDLVAVRGLEVVTAYGDGLHASRLDRSALLRRVCGEGTARNWRTLRALVDLAAPG